jgi:hypothetical protein
MSSKRETEHSLKHTKRRLISFSDLWLKNDKFKEWLRKEDEFTAKCLYCKSNFTVKYEGLAALRRHCDGKEHINNTNTTLKNNTLTNFFVHKHSSEEKRVIAAEVSFVYHSIRHHHSYLSMECGMKLSHKLFPDSSLCKKVHCARTKAEAIAKNVLSPLSIENHLKSIQNKKFSVSIDASNKGNIKLFPLALQYFSINYGIENFVLDFYEDFNESSAAIYDNIIRILKLNDLKIENISGFCADNASVNYGIHKSVFQNLKNENDLILKANCNCHVIHNAAKFGLLKLSLDIENLVIKVYNHFSTSAIKSNALKSCFEYTENEYKTILRHVPTRWLSLFKAIDRLIVDLEGIKSYFLGVGEENCPQIITEFIWGQCENASEITFFELLLHFAHQYMKLFHECILKLEMKSTNSTHLYNIMNDLRTKLKNRFNHQFYGSKVIEMLRKVTHFEKKKFENEALNAYRRCLNYLEKWFDFDNSLFKMFTELDLENSIDYKNILIIVSALNIAVDRDALFDECLILNELLVKMTSEDKNLQNDKLWSKILKSNSFINISKVVETVLSIPIGNDFVERIFSLMEKIWSKERSLMKVDSVKAEICINLNYSMSCNEFVDYVSNNDDLLNAAKSDRKYTFKYK